MTATLLPNAAVEAVSTETRAEATADGRPAAASGGGMRRTTSWHGGGDATAAAAALEAEGTEVASRNRRLLRWEYARFSEMKLLLTYHGPPVSFRCSGQSHLCA